MAASARFLIPLLLLAAAEPAESCLTDWRMVQFAPGSAKLDRRARAILDIGVAAFRARGDGTSRFRLSGSADRLGSSASNRRLSLRRAEAVRDYLVLAGIPRARIDLVALGETQPMVETPDGQAEPNNRNVTLEEIITEAEARRREAIWKASGSTAIC